MILDMRQASIDTFEPLPVRTMPRSIVRQVLAAIFRRQFEANERLVIQRLADQLGVSPTPVREALGELAALGMIDLVPNRGPVVRPFGPNELDDIYRVRALLESEAARLACGRIPSELLRNNKRALKQATVSSAGEPLDPAFDLDLQLHDLVREHCGSPRLSEEIMRYRELIPAIRDVVGDDPNTQHRALEEHTKIIDALLAGNADDAASAMRAHVESSGRAMCKALFTT